jgi:hypothetical protein
MVSGARPTPQKAFGNPACFKIALAVCALLIFEGTAKCRRVIGLNQISWLPLPHEPATAIAQQPRKLPIE